MPKILCLIESIGSGGAERQLTGLAVMLKQKGYDVEVCYYVSKDFYRPYLQKNGVVSRLLPEAVNPRKRFFTLRKYIKSYKPDTVISYSISPNMIMCLLKMMGAKFNLIVSERNTTQKIDIWVKLRFFLYRWANYVVPNSQSQKDFIKQHFPHLSGKIKVITNFVDLEKFSPGVSHSISNEVTGIICVGRLMPQKNILHFIEAIGKVVKDGYTVHVDWYGQDLKDDYSEKCHNTLNRLNLNDVFVFHEPSISIQDEYKTAEVFCLPSLYEGFPNVLCEAMSCGLPVLCSRVCDNPNIVVEGINGLLFNPLNFDDIVGTIERFVNLSKDKKKEMGGKSREIAMGLFSSDTFLQQYISIV